jgi:RimJ/RimL family protein N-acetyltransferase
MFRTQRLSFVPVTREAAEAIIAGDLSAFSAADGWPHVDTCDGLRGIALGAEVWLVLLGDVVIGDCGTHGPADADGVIEIGYGIAESVRRRGFGNEIAAGLADHLATRPEVRRIVANNVLVDNVPSRRALENAGFALVAETDGTASYARLINGR